MREDDKGTRFYGVTGGLNGHSSTPSRDRREENGFRGQPSFPSMDGKQDGGCGRQLSIPRRGGREDGGLGGHSILLKTDKDQLGYCTPPLW